MSLRDDGEMWGHNMPGREGTRRAEGASQGPRVTTGHPDLPGPSHVVASS